MFRCFFLWFLQYTSAGIGGEIKTGSKEDFDSFFLHYIYFLLFSH